MKVCRIIVCFLCLGATAFAQQMPHLAYVYPAGGKIGTTFEITVGGQFLLSVSNAYVTDPAITATVIDHLRPMNQKDFTGLRERWTALQQKFQAAQKFGGTNSWTAADAQEREDIRGKILRNPPNRTINQAMMDSVIARITIATNATAGDHELRLATPNGLSNPVKFCIGGLPEITKTAARPANPDLDRFLERMGGRPVPPGTPKYEARVALPATINGQIMPGGVDRYRFHATRGRQIILVANARSLMPYLADAVPGWFECVLTIYDSTGAELASQERFHFRPDPVVHFQVPHDGDYTVEIHDSIFRGRQDFVYRLTIGELPYVTGIYPLGGRAGEKTAVTLTGWNLSENKFVLDNSAADPGVTLVQGNFFNAVPFSMDTLPEVAADGANHSIATAQSVTLPVIVNGRVSQPDEPEIYKFEGHAGGQVVAEIFARRLDSPLDSFLRLTDAAGRQLAFNDDFEDKGSGLNTHHADSYLTATLPSDGAYYIHLTDTQGHGGPEYAYRLRISQPQPDFTLRIVPSSLSLRAGMSLPVTAYAMRRDGFTNAIDLALADAPPGFSLGGATIPAGQDKVQFTLKAPPRPLAQPANVALSGQAFINEKSVTRTAVPAEDMMQAFFYRHLVPSSELLVTVNGQARPIMRDAFKIISAVPVKIPPGGAARVKISAPAGAFTDRFKLELDNPPDGISLENVVPVPGGLELTIACDAEKMKAGATGNLICAVVPKTSAVPAQKKKPGNQASRNVVATLPAIPFTIAAEPAS